jgi:hypothetical protein
LRQAGLVRSPQTFVPIREKGKHTPLTCQTDGNPDHAKQEKGAKTLQSKQPIGKTCAKIFAAQNEKGDRLLPIPRFLKAKPIGLLCSLRHWQDRNEGAFLKAFVESDFTFDGSKDGVVFAHADAFTRPHLGTALTHDDVARNGGLATVEFYAKAATS